MIIYLIRHGAASSNLSGRYIGSTDEPLCDIGRAALMPGLWPPVDNVVCSPMRRCVETADILYPMQPKLLMPGLKECAFGDFEGKNHADLNGSADYQRWIDSGGTLPFPGGEDRAAFSSRCIAAFDEAMASLSGESIAFVVHGGTIMAIMEHYAFPKLDYYQYQVKNGCGYAIDWDCTALHPRCGDIPSPVLY